MTKQHLFYAALALVIVLVAAAVALSWANARTVATVNDSVAHTKDVETQLEMLARSLIEVESGARGYALSGNPAFLPEMRHGAATARARLQDLHRLTTDDLRQQQRLVELDGDVSAKIAFNERIVARRDRGGIDAASELVASGEGQRLMETIRSVLDAMRGEERSLLQSRTERLRVVRRRTTGLIVALVALIAAAIAAFAAVIAAEARARRNAAAAVRASEERLRLLLGAVRDYAILELDTDARVTRWSEAAERMFGYSSAEAIGQSVARFHSSEEDAARELAQARQEGRFEDESLRVRKDGTRFVADVVVTAIRDDRGELRGFAKVVRDVTDRRKLVDDLRDTTRKLELSNRELQDFAMVASHDLQEPLRKVQMFGDRLKRRYEAVLGDEGRDYITRMMNAAARGQSLIQGLLAFSRVTTKAQRPVPVDLGQTARDVVSDLEARLLQVGGAVRIGPLPTVEADPLQMRQLLQNLIGNALKFRKPDVPPVVSVTGERRNGSGVHLEIADNGIGFDPKYVDRIFKLFQRLHERGAYEGSGMGLAICRKIVERHGGNITARSAPGEGATFVVELPDAARTH